MSVRHIRFHIDAAPPQRLDKALARDVPVEASLSRTRLARLIDEGGVSVNGTVTRDPKARVAEGAEIVVALEEAQDSHILPETIELDIVYEDGDLLVVCGSFVTVAEALTCHV
mgnify:CR=1 FL=1